MPEPRIVESRHADGWPHARATVRRMASLAREAAQSYEIRSLATAIVQDVPSKQTTAELAALYRWVRDHVRYRFDPIGVEWLQSPSRTLAEGAGDCDDIATLLAALAESLGHETRYHVVGPDAQTPQHVAVEAWDGTQWVTLDPVLEPPAHSTDPRDDLGEFGRRAEGHMVHFDNRGSQLGDWQSDYELWKWQPLAYTDTGLLVPVHPAYAGLHYNYPSAAMPDAVRPAGILGQNQPLLPDVILPRGCVGAPCTCPMSDRNLGLGYWVNTGIGFNPIEWTKKNLIDPVGGAVKDGFQWAKEAVSDGLSWMKGAYEDALGAMKPIADVALVVSSIPGVDAVLGAVVPGGKVITRAIQQWSVTVQKLSEGEGIPLDVAGEMAFNELPPDMQDALKRAPEAMAEVQNLDLSVLEDAGLDPDVLAAINQVRGNIPPDIDFSAIADEVKDPREKPAPKARAAVSTTTTTAPRSQTPQTAPVPSDADPLIQFTSDVIDTAERDPQAAAELIQSGIHFAMASAFPRQRYDPNAKLYRIYAPNLSGLGAAPRRSEDIRELAFNAGLRVAEIIDETGSPPRIPVAEVREFQAAVDTPADGLWGPNTRLAASYYLTVPLEQIPEVHRAFRDTPTTWEPPPEPRRDTPDVAPAPPSDDEPIDVTGPTRVRVPTTTPQPPAPEPPPTMVSPDPPQLEPPPRTQPTPVIDVTGPRIVPEPEPPPPPPAPPPEPEPPPPPPGDYREVGTSPVDPGLPELDTGVVVEPGPSPRRPSSGAWPLLLAWIVWEAM